MIPELERLQRGVDLLQAMRQLFYEMPDDGERDRAWAYLSNRFGEYEKSDVPAWEQVEYDQEAESVAP